MSSNAWLAGICVSNLLKSFGCPDHIHRRFTPPGTSPALLAPATGYNSYFMLFLRLT